jgi:WD40 repeat protein/beta-lactamase regulating signal transducer with metallopeptidase domain
MDGLVQVGLSNAIVAGGLAVLVWSIGLVYRRPAVLHVLWLLVLIKLVTPPLIALPLSVGWVRIDAGATPSSAALAASARPTSTEMRPFEASDAALGATELHSEAATPVASPDSLTAELHGAGSGHQESSNSTGSGVAASAGLLASWNRQRVMTAIGIAWACGAAFWLSLALWRVVTFHRCLRRAILADKVLQCEVDRLARELGIRRPPRTYLVAGAVSPMLWAFGGRAQLIFPERLASELDPAARQTLILHELAHYRRGDHWVRWLEVVATTLHWWNPIAWWALREIRAAEEECCDAWVVARRPQQRGVYARALLRTLIFISDARLPLPPAASGVGQGSLVKERIRSIMTDSGSAGRPLRWPARGILLLIAAAVLPLWPALAHEQPAAAPPASQSGAQPPKVVRPPANEPTRFAGRTAELSDIRALTISQDGELLAMGHGAPGARGAVSIWHLRDRSEVAAFDEPRGVQNVALSPDRRLVAYSTGEGVIRVRNMETKELVKELSASQYPHAPVAFSHDGKRLAIAKSVDRAGVWNVADWLEVAVEFEGEAFQIMCLKFSPDDAHLLASGGSFAQDKPFGRATAWDAASGKIVCSVDQSHVIMGVDYTPDGSRFATACLNPRVLIVDAKTGAVRRQVFVPNTALFAVRFSSNGEQLVAIGPGAGVTVFNPNTGERLGQVRPSDDELRTGDIAPDRALILAGGRDQRAWLIDAATHRPVGELPSNVADTGQSAPVQALAHSPDGQWLAIAREDGTIAIQSVATGAIAHELKGHEDSAAALAFSPDSAMLASGSYDRTIKLWDVAAGRLARTLTGHGNWVFGVAFSPDGKRLASCGYDKTVRLWDLESKTAEPRVLEGHTAAVRAVAFSPAGEKIASAGSDRAVNVWNAETGELATKLEGHEGAVRSLAFSPDGAVLATAGEDKSIRLWKTEDWKEQRTLTGHEGMVWSVAFSAGGKNIASGGFDHTVRVWDPATGQNRQTLRGHTGIVAAVSFAPDTSCLVSGSADGTIRSWKAVAAAVGRAGPRIFRMNVDGSDLRAAVAHTEYDGQGSPDWSADGRLIAFDAWRASAGESYQQAHVFIVDAAGGEPRDLGDGAIPQIAPGGRSIVYSRYSPNEGVWLMDARSGTSTLIDRAGWAPTWSPDGAALAYVVEENNSPNIAVVDLATGSRELLLSSEHATRYRAVAFGFRFSPDGSRLAFRGEDASGRRELAVASAAGSLQGFEVLLTQNTHGQVAWHPTSGELLISSIDAQVGISRLFTVNPQGAATIVNGQLRSHGNQAADWSPDGRQIVFSSQPL